MMGAFAIHGQRAIGPAGSVFVYTGFALALSPCATVAVAQDSAAVGVWDLQPEQRWQVSESLRIGERDGEGPAVFGYARCVAVDPMDRIWVVEVEEDEIRVFGADGNFVRTVGTMEENAREFQDMGDAFPGPGNEIWISEYSVRRYQVYDTAGTWIEKPFVRPGTKPGRDAGLDPAGGSPLPLDLASSSDPTSTSGWLARSARIVTGLPGSLWAPSRTCSRLPIGMNPWPFRTRSAEQRRTR